MALAHPFDHFHLRAAPQGPFTPAPGSRRHSASSQISGMRLAHPFFSTGSGLRILQLSHRDQGWVKSRECSFEQASCIIYQIFRMRSSQLDCVVPKRSGSTFPLKGILDVHCTTLFWIGSGGCACSCSGASQLGFGRFPNMPTSNLHQGQLTCKVLTLPTTTSPNMNYN